MSRSTPALLWAAWTLVAITFAAVVLVQWLHMDTWGSVTFFAGAIAGGATTLVVALVGSRIDAGGWDR